MENYIFYLVTFNNWSSVLGQFFRILLTLAFVIILIWYVLKLMSYSRKIGKRGGNLSIIESISLSTQSGMHIIRAGEKYLLVGVTKESITMLTELNGEQLDLTENKRPEMPFDKILQRFLRKGPDGEDKGN